MHILHMKYCCTFFIGITLFAWGLPKAEAQKSLRFNQVKLVSTAETVPAGKVWKIENIGSSLYAPVTTGLSSTPAIIINGNPIYLFVVRTSNSSNYLGTPAVFFPIWLPAATTLAASNNINFISVIEFIETP